MLNIDLNVTSVCNLACSYCSEGVECGLSALKLKHTEVTKEEIIEKINTLLEKDTVKINFWGGEPLSNWKYCKDIMMSFLDEKRISFFFYTNGILVKDHIDDIKYLNKNLQNKLIMQISYDGEYLTDTIRVDKSGKGTAKRVKEAYKLLKENDIETSLKSVISHQGFEHLYDSFLDIYGIQGHYNPTPDLYSEITEEEIEPYFDILEKELMKISQYIYNNDLSPNVFSWFRQSRAICSAGADIAGVDLNGKVYPCHGVFYDNEDVESYSIDDIENVRKNFKEINKNLPIECQTCNVNFCMKCQASNLRHSKKETFAEKWTDYQSNWSVCRLFKLNDVYNKTIRYAMNEKGIK